MESLGYLIIILIFITFLLGIKYCGELLEERSKKIAAAAAQKAEKDKIEAALIQNHRNTQQSYRKELIDCGEKSLSLFESIPKYLNNAELFLDEAENNFIDGAYAPFWNSIEYAANNLGCFDNTIRSINIYLSRYADLTKKYEGTPIVFPLAHQSITRLGVGRATSERMEKIVRKAQRNFQFSMIYEQRKTNQILIAGFTNLAHALDNMTWQISSSIDDLASSVGAMASNISESVRSTHSQMADISESNRQLLEELRKADAERTERENIALKILDNIQRRKSHF